MECNGKPACSAEKHYMNCHIWYAQNGMTNFLAKKFEDDPCQYCVNGIYHNVEECERATKEGLQLTVYVVNMKGPGGYYLRDIYLNQEDAEGWIKTHGFKSICQVQPKKLIGSQIVTHKPPN